MSDKLTFIIDINCFLPSSGGIVALHTLCDRLRFLGEEAFTLSDYTHPLLNAPKFDGRRLDKSKTVVVYPEIVLGNPHKAQNVVRWILNTPGECAGVTSGFYENLGAKDLIFKYSEYFNVRDLSYEGLLTTSFIDTNLFRPDTFHRGHVRKGTCFLVKKGGMKERQHPDDSYDLSPHENNWQEMARAFHDHEYFYCYDNACFWVVVAAICGCTPIIIPDSDMSAEEWYSKFPHKRCGIAYGFDQMKHAYETRNKVPHVFAEYQQQHLDTVKNFVKVCYDKFL